MRAQVDCWNPKTKRVKTYSWSRAPKKQIVFVRVTYGEYMTRLLGYDCYFYQPPYFGVFSDDVVSETSHADPGFLYEWDGKELTRTIITEKPRFIKTVKYGIWVPEPYARELELTNG